VFTRSLKFSSYVAALLRTGLITGVVLAVALFPLVGIAGLAVLAGAEFIDKLPDQLREVPPAQVSYLYAADGQTLITQFYEEYRKYVPLREISPNIQKAIVASEDSRFYEHNGVDPKGIIRAFVANRRSGGVSQGASTLTMQYVRNASGCHRSHRANQCAQDQGDAPRGRGREGAVQGADPGALP
jgi:membrane peptidoglycan carboxypeptidase